MTKRGQPMSPPPMTPIARADRLTRAMRGEEEPIAILILDAAWRLRDGLRRIRLRTPPDPDTDEQILHLGIGTVRQFEKDTPPEPPASMEFIHWSLKVAADYLRQRILETQHDEANSQVDAVTAASSQNQSQTCLATLGFHEFRSAQKRTMRALCEYDPALLDLLFLGLMDVDAPEIAQLWAHEQEVPAEKWPRWRARLLGGFQSKIWCLRQEETARQRQTL